MTKVEVEFNVDEEYAVIAERVAKAYGMSLDNVFYWEAHHIAEGKIPDWMKDYNRHPTDFLSWVIREGKLYQANKYASKIARYTDEEEVLDEDEREDMEYATERMTKLYSEYVRDVSPEIAKWGEARGEIDSYERGLGDLIAFSQMLPYNFFGDKPER